jgi:hypothetical protein
VSTEPITHDLMIDAASLIIPAAITGRSAAHFWGADLAGPDDPVEVLVPRGARSTLSPGSTYAIPPVWWPRSARC